MWGICVDISVCDGKLYQRAVEYMLDADNKKAILLRPCQNIEISIKEIIAVPEPPEFVYGDLVSPLNHPDMIGEIDTIIWHFKRNEYIFYIAIDDKKKSKRYHAGELIKI